MHGILVAFTDLLLLRKPALGRPRTRQPPNAWCSAHARCACGGALRTVHHLPHSAQSRRCQRLRMRISLDALA